MSRPGENDSGVSRPNGPPGLDLGRLTGWLDAELPGLRTGPLSAEVIAGGRSNLTYRLTDGGHTWALRRPPLGHVLPTAHDMAREYTVISGLHGSAVPVPEPVALCTDAEVLGQPFYLMSFVPGVVLDQPGLVPDRPTAARTGELLVDTLVALHGVDPAAVGLAGFGRPEGFLPRQVARWHQQFQASVPAGAATPGAGGRRAAHRAAAGSSRAGIVHGDYRLTNVLFSPGLHRDRRGGGLGDGHPGRSADRSRAALRLSPAGRRCRLGDAGLPAAQGFLGPDELVGRYAERTGQSLDGLDWYIAFGYFKLAVIAAGIHARYLQGKTVGSGFEVFGSLRDATLAAAAERLTGRGNDGLPAQRAVGRVAGRAGRPSWTARLSGRSVFAAQERADRAAGRPFATPAVLAELKAEARRRGLWNLFLPDDRFGAGLSVLDYAPLAELSGRVGGWPRRR